jgi:hypothetical protein
MATTLAAVLSIAAKVTGEGAVNAISGAVKKLENTSKAATGMLKGLAGSAGGLGGALGALAPLLSVGGLVAMANGSLKAASGMYDLSQRTGVSVEMLAKFKKAASTSGTDIDTVAAALIKLQRNMAAAASDTGLGRKTKAEIDAATTAVKDGERTQTDIVKRQSDARVQALQDESDRRMGEISKRYRREEQLLNDQWDDQKDQADKAAEKRLSAQVKGINREYDEKRKIIRANAAISDTEREAELQKLQDDEDAALDIVREGAAKQAKERQRAARDAQQQVMDQLNARRAAEEKIIKNGSDRQVQIVKDGASRQIETIKKTAEEAIKALGVDPGQNAIEQQLEDMGLSGKKSAEIFRKLGISVKDQQGNMKNAGDVMLELGDKIKTLPPNSKLAIDAFTLMGKSGVNLRQMLSGGGEAISKLKVALDTAFAKGAKQYENNLVALNGKVGALAGSLARVLLPAMNLIVTGVTELAGAFSKMPGWLQTVVGTLVVVAIGITALAPAIAAVVFVIGTIGTALSGLAIGATIAGWLGALLPFVTWLGTVPALIAGWSAVLLPVVEAAGSFIAAIVGWPLLIGLALVAIGVLLYSFRNQIGAFFGWIVQGAINAFGALGTSASKAFNALGGIASKAWQAVAAGFNTYVSGPISKAWTALVGFLGKALSSVTGGISRIWEGLVGNIKGALRGVLQFAANALNGVIGALNKVIDGINLARGAMKLGPLSQMGYITVPAFAEGGVVNRPTLAMVGEGGQSEYIIPASKMAAASSNYLAGSRGASVLSGGGGGSATPQINITTGPIMQSADGQQWVSLGDLERAQRQTVAAMMAQLRTPAGRYAMGAR